MAAFKFGLRSFGYLFAFFVVFALSATEIGLASDQLQMYGNSYDRWPSMMYKHTVGLALFCGLWGLLQSLFHWATSSLVNAILAFTNLSLWLALGATLDVASPFIMGCTDNVPQAWLPFVGICERARAMEAIGWTGFCIFFILFVGLMVDTIFERSHKPSKEHELEHGGGEMSEKQTFYSR